MQQPKIDIRLSNARIFDINKFEVVKGEKFYLDITPSPDSSEPLQIFSNNDQVLSIYQSANVAVSADEVGTCTLLLMTPNNVIMKSVVIAVVDAIADPAVTLAVSTEPPVLK